MLQLLVRGFLVGLVLGLGFCGVVFAKTSKQGALLEPKRAVGPQAMVRTSQVNFLVIPSSNDYRRRVIS
jgi:hypothetical protein